MRKKKTPETEPMAQVRFRDRVLELRRIPAEELLDNPANWRRHPEEQTGALTSIMEKIGFAGAVIARMESGKVQLLDGHLRKDIARGQSIPVLITDLDEAEAKTFLASYDPLGDLAIMDSEALLELLKDTEVGDEDSYLRKMLADVEGELAQEIKSSTEKQSEVEGMALGPHEHYDYLVVMAQTTHEWNVLCDRLGLKPEKRRKGMGTARAIRATRLLEKLNDKPSL